MRQPKSFFSFLFLAWLFRFSWINNKSKYKIHTYTTQNTIWCVFIFMSCDCNWILSASLAIPNVISFLFGVLLCFRLPFILLGWFIEMNLQSAFQFRSMLFAAPIWIGGNLLAVCCSFIFNIDQKIKKDYLKTMSKTKEVNNTVVFTVYLIPYCNGAIRRVFCSLFFPCILFVFTLFFLVSFLCRYFFFCRIEH